MLRHPRGKGAVESGTLVFGSKRNVHDRAGVMLQSHSPVTKPSLLRA
jgi:hypothetical protein